MWNITMDDFDHSIHIAENDWSSFYDESEACDLLQPSLACLDESDLSDSADPDQQETQRSHDANSCTKFPQQLNQSGTQGSEVDASIRSKRGEMRGTCSGKNAITKKVVRKKTEHETTEEAIDSDANTLQKEAQNDHRSQETETPTEDGGVQVASNVRSAKEPDLLTYSRAGLSSEKERWFVTLNEKPARRRGRSTSVNKKRKQKKPREEGLTGVLGRPESSDGGKVNGKQESEQRSIDLRKYPSDEMKVTVKPLNPVLGDDVAEAVQEAQPPLEDLLRENLHFRFSSCLTCDGMTENTGTERAHSRQMSPQSAAAADRERYDVAAAAEPFITSPTWQKAAVIPDDNSTRPETPEALKITDGGSASAHSQEDERSHIPACSVADSPETYAKAAGKTKPVYAISAFWDEMEKLTIDDILQVRRRSRLPSKPVQEKTMPNPTNHVPLGCDLSDSSLMDTLDTADSDYFTQPDESKSDCCGSELLTSDFEEEYSHFADVSRNPSTNPHCKNQQSPSSYLSYEETSSEGRQTCVPLEDIFGHCLDNQETQTLTLWSRQKYKVQAFKTEALSLLPLLSHYRSGLSLSRHLCLEENTGLKPNCSLEVFNPTSFLSHTDLLDANDQISFPEIVEYFSTESEANAESDSFIVYNSEEMFASPDFTSTLCSFKDDASSFSPSLEQQLIPIFSCSRPTVRELTFPRQPCVFLTADCEREDETSPIRLVSRSFIWANLHTSSAAAAASRFHCWKSLPLIRKIHFPTKGSFCCRGSGARMFPAESEEIQLRRQNPAVKALREGKISSDSSQVFRELEEKQEAIWRTKRDGVFSTVKQSDMCLVCIAFASWVLRSSDPEAADAWKTALLANVSALSAIQYLRQYMKRKSPPQDEL